MEQENDISGSTTVMLEASGDGGPDKLIANGKRCLAAGDANGAVECFQEACSLLAAAHGQVADELAEPYYLYGKALLELSRGTSSVLGSGIPVPDEKPSSDEEEEDEGEAEETEETAMNEAGNGKPQNMAVQSKREITEEGLASEPKQVQGGDNEPVTSSTNGEASGDAPVTNEAEEEKEEESDLQLAWEVLELARVICQKFETNDYRLKLSDVNLLLGEVGLESDQYEQAIQDMKSSLQLRQFVLDSSDRKIAEVHFSLGLAYTLNRQLDEAIHEYKMSKQTLEKRRAKLEGKLSSEGEHDDKQTLESEIKELSDLLPDIDSKIADVNEMKRLKEERANEEEGETSVGFANISESDKKELDSPVTATDISHLVRKRPATATVADASDDEPSAKRPCPSAPLDLVSSDDVENGSKSKVEQEGKDDCHGDTPTVTSTACEQ